MSTLPPLEQATVYATLLGYALTITLAWRGRRGGVGRVRVASTIAVGAVAASLLPNLALGCVIGLRAARGERLMTSYADMSRAVGAGPWTGSTWLAWALLIVASYWGMSEWRRAGQVSKIDACTLVGAALLVGGLSLARARLEDVLLHEIEANIRFDRSPLEWVTVAVPWPIHGLEGRDVVFTDVVASSSHPKHIAIDSDGNIYVFEPWARDGVATRLGDDVRAAFVRPWGRCFVAAQGAAQCEVEPGSRASLPDLQGYLLSDVAAMGATFTESQYCALTQTREQRCWRALEQGYLQDDGVVDREVVAQAMGYYGGYCVLRANGEVGCSVVSFAHGRRGIARGRVEGIDRATQVTTGAGHGACALESTGQVRCWGAPRGDAWVNEDGPPLIMARPISIAVPMSQLSLGHGLCAVSLAREVTCWPENPAIDAHAEPSKVPGLHDAVRVFAGRTSCAAHAGVGSPAGVSNAASVGPPGRPPRRLAEPAFLLAPQHRHHLGDDAQAEVLAIAMPSE